MKLLKLCLAISIFLLSTNNFRAQTVTSFVVSSAGDYVQNGNYSISYTVGETITATLSSSSNILTQGFQQTDYVVSEVTGEAIPGFNVKVYPIPSDDELTIEFSDDIQQDANILLYDELGRIIFSKETTDRINKINVAQLANTYYFLEVTNRGSVRTFKVQKSK
jgi:hypothetical protein